MDMPTPCGGNVQSLLQRQLLTIMPKGMSGAVLDISDAPVLRYPQEIEPVAQANPRRQAEFAAGREAARRALAALGYGPVKIPVGDRRQPVWPAGCTGSITHDRSYAVAVAAPKNRFPGVGIDLEVNFAVSDALAMSVAGMTNPQNAECHAALARQGICANTLQFSAKEAGFKSYFPASGRFLDWPDMGCVVRPSHFAFQLSVRRCRVTDESDDWEIDGKYTRIGQRLLTLALMRTRPCTVPF